MRTLKFRAWDFHNKIMHHAFLPLWIVDFERKTAEGKHPTMLMFGDIVNFNCGGLNSRQISEIMQFTGLLDKNGKEIFEGDIVKIDGSKKHYLIEFLNGSFIAGKIYGGYEAYRMEVIGNIYENPELLEAK